jgi:hypothetical protein
MGRKCRVHVRGGIREPSLKSLLILSQLIYSLSADYIPSFLSLFLPAPVTPSADPRYPTTTVRVTSQRPSTADRPTRSNTVSSRSGDHTRSHSQSRSNPTSTRADPASHSTRTTTQHSTGLKHTPSVSRHTSTRSAAPHSTSRQPHKSHTMDNVVIKNGVPIEPTTRVKPNRSMTSVPS